VDSLSMVLTFNLLSTFEILQCMHSSMEIILTSLYKENMVNSHIGQY
jgi:hypothetical protein